MSPALLRPFLIGSTAPVPVSWNSRYYHSYFSAHPLRWAATSWFEGQWSSTP